MPAPVLAQQEKYMNEIKIISQVVQDLADRSQNTNDMVLGLGSNYTEYSIINLATGGA